jgi:hypothetical protein
MAGGRRAQGQVARNCGKSLKYYVFCRYGRVAAGGRVGDGRGMPAASATATCAWPKLPGGALPLLRPARRPREFRGEASNPAEIGRGMRAVEFVPLTRSMRASVTKNFGGNYQNDIAAICFYARQNIRRSRVLH